MSKRPNLESKEQHPDNEIVTSTRVPTSDSKDHINLTALDRFESRPVAGEQCRAMKQGRPASMNVVCSGELMNRYIKCRHLNATSYHQHRREGSALITDAVSNKMPHRQPGTSWTPTFEVALEAY